VKKEIICADKVELKPQIDFTVFNNNNNSRIYKAPYAKLQRRYKVFGDWFLGIWFTPHNITQPLKIYLDQQHPGYF